MSEASLERRVRELERRMVRLVQVGTVVDVDYPGQRVQVRIGERDSAWLRFTTRRAGEDRTWWPPTVGEQVLVFAPNGDAVAAVAGDSLYQQDYDAPADAGTIRRTVMGDGASFTYDREAKRLTVELPGDAVVEVAGNSTVKIGGDASVEVGGDLSAKAGGKATVDAAGIELNGGSPCVTTAHICHFTGTPHGDGSSTVKAGK